MMDGARLSAQLDELLSSQPITRLEISPSGLPPAAENAHHPFLLCGADQLAIPQKPLALIYAHASQRFHRLYDASKTEDPHTARDAFQLTRLLLIQNPDHLTALSVRRKLIIPQHPDRLPSELELTRLLLSIPSHAKSTALWFHRRWALHHLFPPTPTTGRPGSEAADLIYRPLAELPAPLVQAELEFSLTTCELYPRNYYAWFHRKWLVYQLVHSADQSATAADEALEAERARILRFVRLHPRDHSAANYISFLLSCSIAQPGPLFIRSCHAAFAAYPEYESSWALLKALVLSNTLSPAQTRALIQASPAAQTLRLSLQTPVPASHHPAVVTRAQSAATITLADLHADALRRSQALCLRTLYFLGCHFKWIEWTDELAQRILKSSLHPSSSSSDSLLPHCLAISSLSAADLAALKTLIDRFFA
ncbi:hypothetical protein PTTG_04983 [Puccinia triticina 1-1 BBBD Race 1]|uniref:Geranylgeranyl transferase type-2 subunit alpha n=1 Tax=Puccinia triticina (isolate 1-1 / race 1 (BBBD)) TaxID=630390 RepID=A0A180GJ37_PUCT1|nr:hypothetical protein PTTG_04983 [Puccinia triticina 1-1 BBBD Race 1]